jgi:hypothetical protein
MSHLSSSTQIQSPANRSKTPSVYWVKPGEILAIRNRILPLAQCQVVFHLHIDHPVTEDPDDQVETVNFWFSTPIEGGVPYRLNPETNKLEPLSSNNVLPATSPTVWLLQYSGTIARRIRRLYQLLAEN